jgi:hypothetical protein
MPRGSAGSAAESCCQAAGARARTRMRGVRVAVLPGGTHHSIPAGEAGPLSQLVRGFRRETADQGGP